MGYLNNSVVTVDAILTNKGRELLARGDGSFRITQFALSDDEIAFPETTQNLRYKLVTLPRGTAKMPVLDLGFAQVTLKQGASLAITPQTLNYLGNNQVFEANGYTVTIADVRVLNTFNGVGIQTEGAVALNQTETLGTNVSSTVIGTTINMTATTVNTLFGSNTELNTTLQVVGRDSGARITIPIKITKTNA